MEQAWHQLYDRLVPATARRFNGESLLAKEASAREVVERLATLSMFGPKRLVRVKQVELWNKEQQAIMLSYLTRPNLASCLVLHGTTRKGCEALIAGVEKAGGKLLEFLAPSETELPRWLQEQAGFRHKQLNLTGEKKFGENRKIIHCYVHIKARVALGQSSDSLAYEEFRRTNP